MGLESIFRALESFFEDGRVAEQAPINESIRVGDGNYLDK